MSSIVLKNGQLIHKNSIEKADILIENNIIKEIGNITTKVNKTIDCESLYISPGFVDMHCHLRDPGFLHKEDIESGVKSAVAGGFTSIACMPNTNPPIDTPETVKYIIDKAKKLNLANVYPIANISKNHAGEELVDVKALKDAGAVAISDDGKPVVNSKLMRDAMIVAKGNNIPVIEHCEDPSMAYGIVSEGEFSKNHNLLGVPREAEEIDVARQLIIAGNHNLSVHIAHVSTKGSVEMIRQAKQKGISVTCETCPHYFSLTVENTEGTNPNAKMNPPLREAEDVEAIIEGLKDGTIDAIVTDHAPHSEEEKIDITKCPNGIIGFETALKVCITYLIEPRTYYIK